MYPTLLEEDIKDKFYKLGGVARGVLDLPSQQNTVSPEAELSSALNSLSVEQVCAAYDLLSGN
jgi:hypothetical protein